MRKGQIATILIGALTIILGLMGYNYLQRKMAEAEAAKAAAGTTTTTTAGH